MALVKSKRSEIPKDAVVLSEMEALKYHLELVKKWQNGSEVFALRYGPYILGSTALLSGAFFNNYFRGKFMLGNYGRFASYVPVCLIPGAMSLLLHTEVVLRNVVLMKAEECPVCLELRAAAIQSLLSVGFPLVVAPVGCAALALRYGTYDVPYLHQQPKEAFGLFKKMFSRIQTKTFYLFIAQAFLGSVVTYFESSNCISMNRTLASSASKNEELFD